MSSKCNKSFASNYMLLKPEEAGFFDLAKILFSSDISKRKFVDSPIGNRESFWYRIIIFLTILVMKILQLLEKPMAWVGSKVESLLNLPRANGGLLGLLLNFLRGKVVYPEETSASYLSIIANLDDRLELDNISYGDERYYAAFSMMTAKASYENPNYIQSAAEDHWEMELLGAFSFWNDYQEESNTQAFILNDKNNRIIVAFRGTEPFNANDWSTDVDLSYYEIPGLGKIHAGFLKALGLQISEGWPQNQSPEKPETAYYAIRELLRDQVENNKNVRFIISGHSLGGALAAIFPAILGLHGEVKLLERIEGVYTYGQPRVGNDEFGAYMENLMKTHDIGYFRFVYNNDVVPRIPFDDYLLMFEHFGRCIYYNCFYHGRVLSEVPHKNYFSLIWIPKFLSGLWEIIRSFIPRGSYYKENWLLRFIRLIGLIFPGMPNHMTQDYINITQLEYKGKIYSPKYKLLK